MLDPGVCYRALGSRDARFDGRFFVGVVTTGIYCRPICPAPTPKRRNVRFFPCAAAAAEAGFRPCLRCRPEASPWTPAWQGTSATVSRALRLIDEGALDAEDVESLAARLGLGSRHLRRLFEEHVGASPLAVAQTRRIHFAKKLLDETDLPVTRVALAAGFASVRRFNTALRETYGRPPRELRASARHGRPAAGGVLELRLAWRPPFDAAALTRFLEPRAIPGVECVRDGVYRRVLAANGDAGSVEVVTDPDARALRLRVPAFAAPALVDLAARARRLFDLDADPGRIQAHLGRDRRLAARLRRLPGLRVPGAWDPFELAVRIVLGQQVSVRHATALTGGLVERLGEPLQAPLPEGLGARFPGPERLAEASPAALGGMPRQRAEAIRALARAVAEGRLDLETSPGLDPALEQLLALPGIGPWTAQVIAMRALREPDAFPAGDLGLRRAAAPRGAPPLPAGELERRAETWRPWRAYAAMALWASPDGD